MQSVRKLRITLLFILIALIALVSLSIFSYMQMRIINSAETELSSEEELTVLIYHHLAPEDASDWIFEDNEAVITEEQFSEQMEALYELDYETLSSDDVRDFVLGEKDIPERSVVITFDDGYESNYQFAYPLLKEYEHQAIFFPIISRMEENESSFDPEVLTYMSWSQLKEMKRADVAEVQHHTYDSHDYAEVNDSGDERPEFAGPIWLEDEERMETEEEFRQRVYDDIKKGQKLLESKTGKPASVLAYPFGWGSEEAAEEASRLGIEIAFGPEGDRIQPGDNIWNLSRINVSPDWNLEDFVEAL